MVICIVPHDMGSLGQWVYKQQRNYSYLKEGKESPLDQRKIDLLNNIWFTWTIFATWEDRFEELQMRLLRSTSSGATWHMGI